MTMTWIVASKHQYIGWLFQREYMHAFTHSHNTHTHTHTQETKFQNTPVKVEMVRDHVGNGLCISSRPRAAAVDVVRNARQLVCHAVGLVPS